MGGVAVPVLQAHLSSPTQAAAACAALLAAQTWISIACCALLLVVSKRKYAERQEAWAQAVMVFVLGGLLLALVAQYGMAPRVAARQGAVWQYAAVAMQVLQWLCALCTLWKVAALAGRGEEEATPPA
jgi:cytochrome bd-type quinol oxidase subunit 2